MNVGARLPFRIASFLLAIVFLLGSALGVIDIWRGGKLEFGSKLNTTLGWLASGIFFLALACRGLSFRRKKSLNNSESAVRK
jgi:uncharacterized membrane protein YciS (DUF1049 family)